MIIRTINEFRKILEYNNSAIHKHYQKLVNDGSEEQEALLNTAAWFEITTDYVHQALQNASSKHTVTESLTIRPAYFVKDTESIEKIIKNDFPEYNYFIDKDKENIVITVDDIIEKQKIKNKLMDVIINQHHIDLLNMY